MFASSQWGAGCRRLAGALIAGVALFLQSCGGSTVPDSGASISTQPTDQSVVEGASATFSVGASNATGYQWQRSLDGGTTFADLAGATAASHTTPATALVDSGTRYRVVVSGGGSSVTSSTVTLTVTAAPVVPAITVQPADESVTEGGNASFSVTATGTSPAYQWQRSTDGGTTYADLAGATGATLNLTGVVLAENGHRYRVAVTNSAGSVTSTAAVLTVSAAASAPAFSTHPADASVVAPDTATFSVAATGAPAPAMQWQRSTDGGTTWIDIAGATASSYTTPATGGGDDGNRYRAVATNASGTATSNPAVLTVAVPVAPSFSVQPANASVAEGGTAQFTVTVAGTPTPTLQWQVSTDSGTSWGNVVGATAASYTTPATVLADSGKQYRVVATNASGNATSNAATLTVTAASRVIYSVGSVIYVKNDDGTNGVTLAVDADNSLQGGYAGLTPDGRVVFGAGAAAASVKLDGTGRVTLANGSVAGITPSSRVIIRTADTSVSPANFDLHSVNADGTDPRTLANSASDNETIQNPSIPGSSSATDPLTNLTVGVTSSGKVVYQSQSRTLGGQRDVYIVNEDGTGTLALGSTADDERFATNLPGGRIAYFRGPFNSTPNYTVLIGEDGSNPVSLDPTQGGVVGFESGRVVTRGFPPGQSAIYSFNPDGTGAVTLATGNTVNPLNFKAVSGGRVIYNQGNLQDLYSVPVGGGTPPTTLATIAEQGAFRGVTSNGKVVFGVGNLYTVDLTGSNKTQITNASDFEVFRASTTDGKVIYERLVGGANYDLYIVNTDGSGTVPLAATADIENFAGLTPSGRVLYIRSVVGGTQLWSVKPDGTDPVMLGSGGGTSVRYHYAF